MAQLAVALGIGAFVGCCVGAFLIIVMVAQPLVVGALVKTETPSETPIPRAFPTITIAPTTTRTPTSAPVPSATSIPTDQLVTAVPITQTRTPVVLRATPKPIVQHLFLARPVAPSATSITPALTYLYGTTSRGDLAVHHGEEFVNPTGTPLYAVSDGTIVTAGNDTAQRLCGDDGKKPCGPDINFYGNVVVIQFDRSYNGQRIFGLYGHMNKIGVAVGERVKQGDLLGEIGMTGIALGPHVHFEVRIGVNDYAHTRNPILWMTPLQNRGVLAGRFSDSKGNLQRGAIINLYRVDPETLWYGTETYSRDDTPPVNSDDEINENFAFPDLPPGDYVVRVLNQQYAARVTVEAGKIAFIELGQ
jgi:murein DD-endopeptidase MepM/ murein hydrolase activator NlpD